MFNVCSTSETYAGLKEEKATEERLQVMGEKRLQMTGKRRPAWEQEPREQFGDGSRSQAGLGQEVAPAKGETRAFEERNADDSHSGRRLESPRHAHAHARLIEGHISTFHVH